MNSKTCASPDQAAPHLVSRHLPTALQEAIQAHADRFQPRGADLDMILRALAEVVIGFLSTIPDPAAEHDARMDFVMRVLAAPHAATGEPKQ